MFIDKDKPLPLLDDRDNGPGAVYSAFMRIDRRRQEINGTPHEQVAIIDQTEADSLAKIEQMRASVETAVRAHTDLRGAVHGETKTTVGLGKQDNWRMATMDEHAEGIKQDAFVHPAGAVDLVASRLAVDPSLYIPAGTLPFAFGGLLGDVPQIKYDFAFGEFIQSPDDPMKYLGDTPWEFSTPSGVQLFSTMLPSPVIGRYTPMPAGKHPTAKTEWGGTKIRIYGETVDVRRSRPVAVGGSDPVQLTDLARVSDHMFERNAYYYIEGGKNYIRSLNKNALPFDLFDQGGYGLYSGIFEFRENWLYNFASFYKVLNGKPSIAFGISSSWMGTVRDIPSDVGQPLEVVFNNLGGQVEQWNLPANGKFSTDVVTGQGQDIYVPIEKLVSVDATKLANIVTNLDKDRVKLISFAWLNRLLGKASIRVQVAWTSMDKKFYVNGYIDMEYYIKHAAFTGLPSGMMTIDVTTRAAMELPLQTLDDNLVPAGAGLFKAYPISVANNPTHPAIFSGVFDQDGGHLKTYTLYNRQYISHYKHSLKGTLEFNQYVYNEPIPVEKYSYTPQSTINNDGMYGDHLRHIPVEVTDAGQTVTYLTQTRDWRNRYRWALATVNGGQALDSISSNSGYIGPRRKGLTWVDMPADKHPSFLIENDDLSTTMNVNCLVFTTRNSFRGYNTFTYNPVQTNAPVSFSEEIGVHDEILSWVNENAGQWTKTDKLFFMVQNNLYFFNQCMDADQIAADNIDCYYGVIKDCYVYTIPSTGRKVMRTRGDLATSVQLTSMCVNNKASLKLDHSTILGYDPLVAQDVYVQVVAKQGTVTNSVVMVNLAPFNNFYFEFALSVDETDNTVTFAPNVAAVDPVFKYDAVKGFNVDYDKVVLYGTKIPHRLHINFQTPVALKKGTWSFRRTPNQFMFYTREFGNVLVNGGVMSGIAGLTVFPIGSILSVSGKNTIVKKPLNIYAEDFVGAPSELYARIEGGEPVLYSDTYNPNNYELEPHTGAAPAGFFVNTEFTYHDQYSWRNSLTPVIGNKRLNVYGYGNSIPVFGGWIGKEQPRNRFFRDLVPAVFYYNTAVGRNIPTPGPGTKNLNLNGTDYTTTAQSFTIPAGLNGNVAVAMSGAETFKWAPGLYKVTNFGSFITKIDFSGCNADPGIEAQLPPQVTSLYRAFKGCSLATIPGIQNWDTSDITDFSECFMNTTLFNMTLPGWSYRHAIKLDSMYENTGKFNQAVVINSLATISVRRMFYGAKEFNQVPNLTIPGCRDWTEFLAFAELYNKAFPNWVFPKGTTLKRMLMGIKVFNQDISNLDLRNVVDMSEFAIGSLMFNQPITGWKLPKCTTAYQMFAGSKFNSPIQIDWGDDTSIPLSWEGMFYYNTVFNRSILGWNGVRVTTAASMFEGAGAYNQSLTGLNLVNATTLAGMMKLAVNFNSGFGILTSTKLTAINEILRNCILFNQEINDLVVDNVVTMADALNKCNAFNKPLDRWRTGNCRYFNGLFLECYEFDQNLNGWDVSLGEVFTDMLAKCRKYNQPMNQWAMYAAKSISRMYQGCSVFNSPVPANMGVPTAATGVFEDCLVFNQPIEHIMLGMVDDVSRFMYNCQKFNQPVNALVVGNSKNFDNMWFNCYELDQPFDSWRMDSAVSVNSTWFGCRAWNSAPPQSWGKPTTAISTFTGCSLFNQEVQHLDTSECTSLKSFLQNCSVFNKPLNNLKVGKCKDFSYMLANLGAFDQPLASWNTGLGENMNFMFSASPVFNQNLSTWPVAKVTTHTNFDQGATAWVLPRPAFPS